MKKNDQLDMMVFKDAFDYIDVGIGVMDESGKFIMANSKWLDLFGYSHEEMIKLSIEEITSEGDLAKSKYFLDLIFQDKLNKYSFTKKYIKKNGEEFYGELKVKKRKIDENNFRIIGLISDVTDKVEDQKKVTMTNIDLKIERNYKRTVIRKQNVLLDIINRFRGKGSYEEIFEILHNNLSEISGNKGVILLITDENKPGEFCYIGDKRLCKSNSIYDIYLENPHKELYRIDGDNYINYRFKSDKEIHGSLMIIKRNPIEKNEKILIELLAEHLKVVIEDIKVKKSQILKIQKLKDLTKMFNSCSMVRGIDKVLKIISEYSWYNKIIFFNGDDEGAINAINYQNTAMDIMAREMSKECEEIYYYKDGDSYKATGSIGQHKSIRILIINKHRYADIDIEILKLMFEHLSSILELDRLIESCEEKAMIDPLTGIWNRSYIIQMLKNDNNTTKNSTLVLLDLGNFKIINDRYGHNIGDEVLIMVSKIISKNIRDTDHVARFGGDEFLIYLPNSDQEITEIIMQRLYKKILNETKIKYGYPIHADYGVVNLEISDIDVEKSINEADEKMYYNKRHRKRMELQM